MVTPRGNTAKFSHHILLPRPCFATLHGAVDRFDRALPAAHPQQITVRPHKHNAPAISRQKTIGPCPPGRGCTPHSYDVFGGGRENKNGTYPHPTHGANTFSQLGFGSYLPTERAASEVRFPGYRQGRQTFICTTKFYRKSYYSIFNSTPQRI